MLELEFIFQGIIRMFREPGKFFRDVSRQEMDLAIPIIILFLTGIIMGILVYSNIPQLEKQWRQQGTDLVYNIEYRIRAKKAEAFLFPIFLILFWFLFSIAFAIITSSLGGWGEFKGFFNCTSFLIYPYAVLQVLKLILCVVKPLMFIYWILLAAVIIWTCYILIKIAMGAGQLDVLNAVIAALVPAFFFMLFYLSYAPIIDLLVVSHKIGG